MSDAALETIRRWRKGGPALFMVEALGLPPEWDEELQAGVKRWQWKASELLVKTRRLSVRSGHGCFAPGTQVLRASGASVAVEDVRVGDLLMGPDGASSRRVLELKGGRERMYRFTYSDGGQHVFNESHILCLVATNSKGRRRAGDKVTVTVREWLTWGEDKRRCHAVYRSGVEQFDRPAARLPIPAYVLGSWLGDGHSLETQLTSADPEVVAAWAQYAEDIGHQLKRGAVAGEAYTYSLTNAKNAPNTMREALRSLGIFGNKRVPDAYLFADKATRLELLAGLLDTDGSLSSGHAYDLVQKSEVLARQAVFLARSVGCHATVKQVEKTCANNGAVGTYWRVTITRNLDQIPVRIARKRRGPGHRQRNNLHFGIRSCEPLGEGKYVGFVLDGDHRFLGADFTVLHNTGKTMFEACAVLWFLSCYYPAKVPCTAPTSHQLSDVLWAEIAKWHRVLRDRMPALGNEFEWSTEEFRLRSAPKESFAVARTSRPEQPEALQGFHSENILFLLDEASGIPEQVFQVAEGALSTDGAFVIMCANPTRTAGYFFDSHHKMRARWGALWVNGEETEGVSKRYIEDMRLKYGTDSPIYKVRVRGEFVAAEDGVIPLDLATSSVGRNVSIYGDMVWGLDVARTGVDANALAKRRGNALVDPIQVWSGVDLMTTTGRLKIAYDHAKTKPQAIFIDVIGLGAGVYDRARELGLPVVAVNVAESPSVKEQYERLRDELWFKGREWFETRRVLMPEDDELIGELTTPKFKVLSTGKVKVESKEELKRRGVPSPNRADAFLLTFAIGAPANAPMQRARIRARGSEVVADSTAGY